MHFCTSNCRRRYENRNYRHHCQSLVIFIGHCVLCSCTTHPLCRSLNRPEASSPRGIRCSRVDCPLTPYVSDSLLLEHHIYPILTWISGEFLYHAPISRLTSWTPRMSRKMLHSTLFVWQILEILLVRVKCVHHPDKSNAMLHK